MKLFLLIIFIVSFHWLDAYPAGTSAGTILKYSPGVRHQSLADCGAGIGNDFDSINFNPAILATLSKFNISMLYDSAFSDAGIYYLGVGKPFGPISFAGSFLTFQGGKITINDKDDELDKQSFTAQADYVLSLSAAREIFPDVYLGATAKYFSSTLIEKYADSTIAADAGVFYESKIFRKGNKRLIDRFYSDGIRVGFSVKNIGGELKNNTASDPLPFIMRGGISYPMRFDSQHSLVVCSDILKSNEDEIRSGAGVEYINKDMLFLRLGYCINYEIKNLTWGIGLKYKNFKLDYGMLLNSAINNRHLVLMSLLL
jgi:hypothetical protein